MLLIINKNIDLARSQRVTTRLTTQHFLTGKHIQALGNFVQENFSTH